MQRFELPGLPSSRTAQAAILTSLYAVLTLFALHGPMAANAPFVKLLGSPVLARQFLVAFVQSMFWPLIALLGAEALRGCYEFATRKQARR